MRPLTQSALLAAAAASTVLTACGGDDTTAGATATPPAAAVRVVGTDYAYAMPARIKGGVVAMDFANRGHELHEFALARLDPGHTLADLDPTTLTRGTPPSWLHDIGGVPALTPGAQVRITRRLRPGRYVLLCAIPSPQGTSHAALGMKAQFTVAGDGGRRLPGTDGVIIAGEKRMSVPPITAGTHTLELRNASSGPREFQLGGLRPGKTERDVMPLFASLDRGRGKRLDGPLPLEILGAMQSIPSGTSVYLTATFRAGWTYRVADDEHGLQARFTPR